MTPSSRRVPNSTRDHREEEIDESYVGLQLTLPALDIVEAFLAGRNPAAAMLERY